LFKKLMAPVAVLMLIGVSAASTGGCELLSTVDRSKIPEGSGGHGGLGGTTASVTSSVSGTGGAGGQGGAATGTGGAGGQGGAATGTGGNGGNGGTGGMGGCQDATMCPGVDSECQKRTCTVGVCGVDFIAKDTPLALQTVGDCKTAVCDGVGATTTINAGDPFDDGNPCTDDLCAAGAPTNMASASGTACENGAGGKFCDGNSVCVECLVGADCVSLICQTNKCVTADCLDTVKNGAETDVDCGGPTCNTCVTGKLCGAGTDCASGVCTGGVCKAPACNDVIKNGVETDIDCGGGTCLGCQAGKTCAANGDCIGGSCSGSTCLPTCTDGAKNAAETDVDCGGPTCIKCITGKVCAAGADCASGVCTGGVCKAPTCGDSVKNGAETDVDCGGASCLPCVPLKACLVASDCTSLKCTGGICQNPSCTDAVKNGAETDVDCGGGTCGTCVVGKVCGVPADCTTGVCQGNVCKAAVCGDGIISGTETCDDGNIFNNDGCSTTCTVQTGYTCTGSPSVCVTTCGDGKRAGLETCDDGNTTAGDGCSATCTVQAGYTCTTATPNVCAPTCGDGIKIGAEACDDGNTTANDGCSATCTVQTGYVCVGSPSVCTTVCGDGIKAGAEACDDGNTVNTDGCSSTCTVQAGYTCTGAPSVCTTACGDGVKAGAEACDDGNTVNTDGCSSTCTVQAGYTCVGTAPTTCTAICGDGLKVGAEQCDDGNTTANDGCSATCTVQSGYTCTGTPSACTTICGDGLKLGAEACDDGNTATNDGCSATCTTETGFTCNAASPSVCSATCGDGIKVGTEGCDDANTSNGDGCNATCGVESGYTCIGQPSVCSAGCGDGVKAGTEQCDDGNLTGGDGCSAACNTEAGYTCTGSPSACTTTCGDGVKAASELCDDGNTANGDGCTAACTVQAGFTCVGTTPSICATICGDGVIVGGETCDDGNTVNTDGCSATCAVQSGFTCVGIPSVCTTTCGDGVKAGAEICDDGNTTSSDGCSAVCATETGYTCVGSPSVCTATCGDGLKTGIETCDDSNTVNGDCCSSTCQIEALCEREPNNNKAQADASANVVVTGSVHKGKTSPIGDIDYWKLTLPTASDVKIETFDSTGPLNCATIDTLETLYASDGITVITSDDDTGPNACSLLDPATVPAMRQLQAGVYYIHINDYQNNDLINYTLRVTLTAVCGNNVKEGYEVCDDGNLTNGDGCESNCTVTPVCGNSIKQPGEQCDDGNTANGDGCSATCQFETLIPEVEANNTCAMANGPYTIPVAGSYTMLTGTITPGSDQDWFRFTVPNYADVRFETFDANGPGTCAAIDTQIQLYKADCVTSPTGPQDQGGIGNCSKLDPSVQTSVQHLAPGDYNLQVISFGASFSYTLQVTTVALCGNNVKQGTEQCDDGNAINGDGCQNDCTITPLCGDGLKSLGEGCDDGNTANGDGCSSTCQLETTAEVEANNTCAMANGPTPIAASGAFKFFSGAITPAADQDWFRFTVPSFADVKFETFDGSGLGACATIDTQIQLYKADCATTQSALQNDGGVGLCSRIDPTVLTTVRHLAPGDYNLKVFAVSASVTFNYGLQVTTTALCGNGVKEGSEQCDGGAGCAVDCTLIVACGNGIKQTGEQCDDGNTVGGDGCSATCSWETTAEVEPNDTAAAADTNAVNVPALLLTGAPGLVSLTGTFLASTDKDITKLVVATQSTIRFEILDASGVDCISMPTSTLRLFSSAFVQLKTDLPDIAASGISGCAALTVNLAAGTYYIQASATAVGTYLMQVTFSSNKGSETEPNDTQATSNTLTGRETFVLGGHQVVTDLDWFAITGITAGQSIRAETIEGNAETCELLDVDSSLTLFGANGTNLGNDGDDGRGYCSCIDGTGATPRDSFAHNLLSGTYYVQVKSFSAVAQTGNQFDYRLAITIRNP